MVSLYKSKNKGYEEVLSGKYKPSPPRCPILMPSWAPQCSAAGGSSLPAAASQNKDDIDWFRNSHSHSHTHKHEDEQNHRIIVRVDGLTLQCVRNSCSCIFRFSFIVTRALSFSNKLCNTTTFTETNSSTSVHEQTLFSNLDNLTSNVTLQ